MPNLPRLTIITPTLNQAAFIEKAILSVLNQGYPNLEYLVYDGGSTDGTQAILQKYSGRLKWVSEPDRGQSDAINRGFRESSGEVLAYLNSDDEYEPGALLKVGQYFASHPRSRWLTGKCRIIDPQGLETMRPITAYKNLLLHLRSYSLLKIVDFVSQPSTFWRRSVVEKIGPLDESLHYVMDYDYWLRIAAEFPLAFLDDYLARFRTYPASKTRRSAANQLDEEYQVVRKYSKSGLMLRAHHLHRVINIAVYMKVYRTR